MPRVSYTAENVTVPAGQDTPLIQLTANTGTTLAIHEIRIAGLNDRSEQSPLRYRLALLSVAGSGGDDISPAALDSTESAPGATVKQVPDAGTESGTVYASAVHGMVANADVFSDDTELVLQAGEIAALIVRNDSGDPIQVSATIFATET